jgi:hypothetical protein
MSKLGYHRGASVVDILLNFKLEVSYDKKNTFFTNGEELKLGASVNVPNDQ